MGLFDAITGDAYAKAAKQNAQVIGQGLSNGTDALTNAANNAITYLGVRNGGDALSSLNSGYGQARNDLNSQYGSTQGYLGGIQSTYAPLVQSGQQATDARANALGLNGAAGLASAQNAFQNSLGYNAGLSTGLDSVARMAAARGDLAGGNTTKDLFNYASDYENQQANNYLTQLGAQANNLATGAAGQASGLGAQASASQNQGTALGNLGTGLGQGQASIYGAGATTQNQFGQNVANLYGNATNALVQNNNTNAQGQTQASSNLLGGLLGVGKLAAGATGSSGGLLNLFGGSGSLFGGGGWGSG